MGRVLLSNLLVVVARTQFLTGCWIDESPQCLAGCWREVSLTSLPRAMGLSIGQPTTWQLASSMQEGRQQEGSWNLSLT